MIVFHRVSYKNFLSAGDSKIEVQLDKSQSTLITGANGSGKSQLIDAISYSLFGRAHRNINKPQLINSINGRHMEVEIEFSIGRDKYNVIRGMKPNKFEIWQNGQMINQDSHNRDYQRVLEQNILKLNHKTFHQVVVLGSSSYVPFMQLPAGHRRSVIEDLLDINIFTKMNVALKEKSSKLRDNMRDLKSRLELNKARIISQEKHIRDLKEITQSHTTRTKTRIRELMREIERLRSANEKLEKKTHDHVDLSSKLDVDKRLHGDARVKLSSLKSTMRDIIGESKFYEENDHCPTCSQRITKTIKQKKLRDCRDRARSVKHDHDATDKTIHDLESRLRAYQSALDTYREYDAERKSNDKLIASIESQIEELSTSEDKKSADSIGAAERDLDSLVNTSNTLRSELQEMEETAVYYTVIGELLKDSGIKTKVIRQYLPIINKLVNNYLQVLDFFVLFNLDENFDEIIKSRHREEFNYASFSEGEKARINLAILFTWRQVAKMKNSIATNLLILDETFDSSLDTDGMENLIKILKLHTDSNIFIISHKLDVLDGVTQDKIEIEKYKNFSRIKR